MRISDWSSDVCSSDLWLAAAERLLDRRVGTEGCPPWRALVLPDAAGSVVLLAVSHALADYRTGLWIAGHFLAGTHPGPLAPACEEALPAALFGPPEAADLTQEGWLTRAARRLEEIGLGRLAAVLPSPASAGFDLRTPRGADAHGRQSTQEA